MKSGKAIVYLGSCLMVLIIFSAIIVPTLSATYTVTSQTTTTYTYYYSFYLSELNDDFETSTSPMSAISTPTQTQTHSVVTFHGGTLPTHIESIIYSTEIYSGRPRTSIVSIIYKSGYYVPPSSMPVSSEPWWMKPYSSSSTSTSVFSSVPESPDVAAILSTESSSKVKPSKVSNLVEPSALSSELTTVVSVKSSDEIFTVSNAAAEPSETAPNLVSYWWTLLIALILILISAFILLFNKKPKRN